LFCAVLGPGKQTQKYVYMYYRAKSKWSAIRLSMILYSPRKKKLNKKTLLIKLKHRSWAMVLCELWLNFTDLLLLWNYIHFKVCSILTFLPWSVIGNPFIYISAIKYKSVSSVCGTVFKSSKDVWWGHFSIDKYLFLTCQIHAPCLYAFLPKQNFSIFD
jgi:glycosyltransferase involved in cell wall biosynthesis